MMLYNAVLINVIEASVAKLVDARDLKSLVRKDVPVRLRPEAPIESNSYEYNLINSPDYQDTSAMPNQRRKPYANQLFERVTSCR
jgi:hypothetical protein